MKKFLSVLVLLLTVVFATAQTPKINYQAVVRDSHNRLVANTTIQVEVTVTYSGGTYSEDLSGTTNANGLLSLEIGGGTNFNLIDWSTATIQTKAHLPGNEILQDEVNVTAVPFALYANRAADVNPNAPTVVAIYNDMLLLSNRIEADSNSLVLFEQKMKADSAIMKGLVDANISAINSLQNADASLSQRITADSNNLENFKLKEKADSLALGTLIDANATAINTLAAKEKADSSTLGQRISAIETAGYITKTVEDLVYYTKTTELESTYATKLEVTTNVDSVKSNLRKEIGGKADTGKVYTRTIIDDKLALKANSAYVDDQLALKASTAYVDEKLALKANSADLATVATSGSYTDLSNIPTNLVYTDALQAMFDSLTRRMNILHDSLLTMAQNMPKMGQQTFTATANQTLFVLANKPNTNCIYRMYINGVMVSGNGDNVLTVDGDDATGKTMKYTPSANGDKALADGDKVTIVYWYLPTPSTTPTAVTPGD
jgi:hypothetical protein